MLLPSDFTVDWPLLPPLDKMAVTAVTTLLLCWMKGTQLPPARRSILMYIAWHRLRAGADLHELRQQL